VLLNHTGRLFDVQVMAHELGHGLHFDRCFPAQSVHVALPAFACLVALVLMSRRRDDPEAFAHRYLEFLDRGGSASPAELLAPLGVDLHDPGIWDEGLLELERMVDQAEREMAGKSTG